MRVGWALALIASLLVSACAGERSNPSAPRSPPAAEPLYVTLNMPGTMMPIERGERFEGPLSEQLESTGIGEVTGGGTELGSQGEPVSCDIEIELTRGDALPRLERIVAALRPPSGSALRYLVDDEEQVMAIGAPPR